MPARSENELLGSEWDWLACDAEGAVALFCTAGGGYTPPAFLENTDAHDAAIDALFALPVTTEATFVDAEEGYPQVRNGALRGVYMYDADMFRGPYRRIATPNKPAKLRDLPREIRDVAIRLGHIRFDDLSVITRALIEHEATRTEGT